MIYPSIDKLQTIVDSKYTLVYIAANRSKQMIKTNYYQKPISEYHSKKETIDRNYDSSQDKRLL